MSEVKHDKFYADMHSKNIVESIIEVGNGKDSAIIDNGTNIVVNTSFESVAKTSVTNISSLVVTLSKQGEHIKHIADVIESVDNNSAKGFKKK